MHFIKGIGFLYLVVLMSKPVFTKQSRSSSNDSSDQDVFNNIDESFDYVEYDESSTRTLELIKENISYTLTIRPLSDSYPFTINFEESTNLTFSYYLMSSNSKNSISNSGLDHFQDTNSRATNEDKSLFITASIKGKDLDLLQIVSKRDIPIKADSNGSFILTLKGKLPGRANLLFKADNGSIEVYYKVYIEVPERTIDTIFTAGVILLVVFANIGMGAKVDLTIVKKELKKPIAPIIGMCCQFIVMPLIAFTFAYNLSLDPGVALGFFALGCSPGGSASNIYTYLLKGSLSLSITMTLISSLASLGFLPLWLFTLGRLIYDDGDINIPYSNIILSLVGLVLPISVGLFLQWKFPKVANFFIKSIKYIVIVFFVFVFSVGIYANWFVFLLISWNIIIVAACLPYLGFVLGGLLALLTRQPKANVIAIAVETGIQNTGIPIILLRLSLSGPDKTTSIVTPVVSAIFTPIPIMFAIAYVQTRVWLEQRRNNRKESGAQEESNSMETVLKSSFANDQSLQTDDD